MPATSGEPSHYAKDGVGGLHYVGTADNLADFPANLKEPGMLVFVRDVLDLYTWTGSEWISLGYLRMGDLEADLRNLIGWREFQ